MKCVECSRPVFPRTWDVEPRHRHHGRNMCSTCYGRLRRSGFLDDCERLAKPSSETAKRWLSLKARGWSRAEAAHDMGTTVPALEQALSRHNRARRCA